jgi:hypothetical protein
MEAAHVSILHFGGRRGDEKGQSGRVKYYLKGDTNEKHNTPKPQNFNTSRHITFTHIIYLFCWVRRHSGVLYPEHAG